MSKPESSSSVSVSTTAPEPSCGCRCQGCNQDFSSRNAVFKHLLDTQGACLPLTEQEDFLRYVLFQQRQKVLLLFGYICSSSSSSSSSIIRNGDDAALLLLQVLTDKLAKDAASSSSPSSEQLMLDLRIHRAYGCSSRGTSIVAQDDHTGALTEVLTARLPPLTTSLNDWIEEVNAALAQRLLQNGDADSSSSSSSAMVRVLGRLDLPPSASKLNAEMDYSHRRIEYLLPMDCFWDANSSRDQDAVSMNEFFRKIFSFDDASCGSSSDDRNKKEERVHYARRDETLLGLQRPTRETLQYMHGLKKKMQLLTCQIEKLDSKDPSAVLEKEFSLQKRDRMRNFHKINKKKTKKEKADTSLCEKKEEMASESDSLLDQPVGAVRDSQVECDEISEEAPPNDGALSRLPKASKDSRNVKKSRNRGNKGTHVLRRRRFHNFTPTVVAHEFLAFRRLDRFYHRATIRFEPDSSGSGLRLLSSSRSNTMIQDSSCSLRPFIVLSLNGDLFLNGQAPRLVGLFVAMALGIIDSDIVDCVFDEKYPHLVPTPTAPLFAMHAAEAYYVKWEGKLKAVLTPRSTEHFAIGWNDEDTLRRVHDWTTTVRELTAQTWVQDGTDENGRLVSVRRWTETVLEPWASRAREQLKDYRQWKASQTISAAVTVTVAKDVAQPNGQTISDPTMVDSSSSSSSSSSIPLGTVNLPPLESVDPTVPALFEKALFYLRKADSSGMWPSTTAKRQLVMMSSVKEGYEDHGHPASATCLAVAHMRANSRANSQQSAYIFDEGQGGASGSFSVGAMPDGQCTQPKANKMFPELMKAAFELELALRPDRESSSTIAINRNAQFRPHTDSGAGVGQGTSLIVGLGAYTGGELVVEGEMKDIRYKAVEFNGWKQRHWTMPFLGERYSLVWFTPKGCDGVRGMDLCTDIKC